MTTTPTAPRHIDLPVDALADLYQGYLCLNAHFDDNWSVALVYAGTAQEEDIELAARLTLDGVPILWLDDWHLHQLATGRALLPGPAGQHYLITVSDVEELGELLDDRDDDE